MRKKIVIISILLVSVIICSLFVLQGFAIPNYNDAEKTYASFYSQEKNSLEGIYIGASSVTRYWNPPLAFNQDGIVVGSLATTSQPFVITPYIMKEALRRQDPKVFVIELRCVFKNPDYISEKGVRYVTDNMKPSILRLQAVHSTLDYMYKGSNRVNGNVLSVYFPSLEALYRKLKGELDVSVKFNLPDTESLGKGFTLSPATCEQTEVAPSGYNLKDREPLPAESYDALIDLLDYCDTIDNNVIFVLSPYSAHKGTYPKINTAIDIIEDRGYEVINYNTEEMIKEVSIDWKTDFYDGYHANYIGAEKYTTHLSKYLKKKYNLNDYRENPNYGDWHEAYYNYKRYIDENSN